MSNPYAAYKTDATVEAEGVWFEEDTFRIRIRRAGGNNTKYKAAIQKVYRENRRAMDTGTLAESVAARKMREVFVDTIIAGWEVRENDGAPWQSKKMHSVSGETVEASRDNMLALLEEVPELFKAVQEQASSLSVFSDANLEADAKN